MKDKSQTGFTLIEIIIAVMILAISLTTLLGLQSASMNQAVRTRNAQEAMLAARTIMSGIEYAGGSLKNREFKGTVTEVAKNFIIGDVFKPLEAKQQIIPLQAFVKIEYWPVKGLPDDAMQKITLTVSWSSATTDQVTIYYFQPSKGPTPIDGES